MQSFSNIRVVDLTHVIAGPFSTYQLAILGADVIKIENAHSPDMVRAKGSAFPDGEQGLAALFTAQNANKRSIGLDIKTDQGKSILKKLIESADVLVENYRSGALEKLGFGYRDVRKIKPDIIYCSLTGFGQDGPLAQRTAYDNVIQAYSGMMTSNGDEQTSPIKTGPPVLDYGTGIQAAFAIAAALYQRTFTGQGQYIDITMLDSAIMLMSCNLTHLDEHNQLTPLTGNMSPYNAGYGCYPTKDGLLMLGAYTGVQVKNMWQILGDPEYGETFTSLQPTAMAAFLESDKIRITEILSQKTAAKWELEMNSNKVPAARVRTLDETLSDPQIETRGVVQSIDNQHEPYRVPVAAFKYESNGPKLTSPPPYFAEHTWQVMAELGYTDEQIKDLSAGNIIALGTKRS